MVKKEFKPVNKTESKRLKDGLIGLVKEYGPIGVRGLYYRAVCAGLVHKTEKEYGKVQRALKDLRISGDIEWDMITDCSRNVQSVNVWDNVKDVIDCAVEQIRLDTWLSQQYQVQIWLEKEGLAPLLNDTVSTYRVPLYTGKGFSSLSFTRQACLQSLEWQSQGQRAVVLQFGDYDPSGVCISESLENQYKSFGDNNAQFRRVGLNKEHIEMYSLPTRPTKSSDTRAASFGDNRSVELDALQPAIFQKLVTTEIEKYIDWDKWNKVLADEEAQRSQYNN